ncbi:MAG: hypothetical protein K0S31_708 [Sphingobacterium multivorum]|jgi:hypothetical protein|nr:hypothetical protein [Sphingobacterium multivorum]
MYFRNDPVNNELHNNLNKRIDEQKTTKRIAIKVGYKKQPRS